MDRADRGRAAVFWVSRRLGLVLALTILGLSACGEESGFRFDLPVEDEAVEDEAVEDEAVEDGDASDGGASEESDGQLPEGDGPSIDALLGPPNPGGVGIEPGVISGFGVNGQPRQWGTAGAAVAPALDAMVNDLGASVFRVEIYEGQSDWEPTNDDDDPTHIDWAVFDQAFSADHNQDLYAYVRELNRLGVDAIEISAHGLIPEWMGRTDLAREHEAEFVETMVAFLLHATSRSGDPAPQFRWFSPFNETDLGPPEGINMGVDQQVRVLELLAETMRQHPELDGISLVGPESANEQNARELRNEWKDRDQPPVVAYASHRYGGELDSAGFDGADPPQWLTEFNDWAGVCYGTSWYNALQLGANVVSGLRSGFTAALVWADLDAPHSHQDDEWQTFGLMRPVHESEQFWCGDYGQRSDEVLDTVVYEPKATYDAFWHVARFVRPGAVRIPLGSHGDLAVAFRNSDGTTVVVGVNLDESDQSLMLGFDLGEVPDEFAMFVSDQDRRRSFVGNLTVDEGIVEFDTPGGSVYSLVGIPTEGS